MPAHLLDQEKVTPSKRLKLVRAVKGSIVMTYTNWRGQTQERYVTPIAGSLRWHEGDKYHPKPQWTIDAWDHEKQAIRTFTLKDIQFPIQTGDL
jgi:predicted DNA-binding transcriptional regulator YafY